jgi:hypothetical protein
MKTFVAKNTRFAERLDKISNEVLKDIKPGKRHHSIPIISITLDVSSVFGMTFVEFGMLYTVLTGDLLRLPHCPMELGPSDSSPYCENRLKRFMVLYRLKWGCSYRHMEVTFGWSHNAFSDWSGSICGALSLQVIAYHIGILESLGSHWWKHQPAKHRQVQRRPMWWRRGGRSDSIALALVVATRRSVNIPQRSDK